MAINPTGLFSTYASTLLNYPSVTPGSPSTRISRAIAPSARIRLVRMVGQSLSWAKHRLPKANNPGVDDFPVLFKCSSVQISGQCA